VKKLIGFLVGGLLLVAYTVHLWFVIPEVPFRLPLSSSDLYALRSSLGVMSFDGEVNRGVWFGKDEQQFYWDWYGMQTVGIIYFSYGPDETKECAVHVEWTNGLETCLNAPSVGEKR
jgi:hypothetical protein